MRFRGLGGNSLNKHAFLILISESPACEVLYRAKIVLLSAFLREILVLYYNMVLYRIMALTYGAEFLVRSKSPEGGAVQWPQKGYCQEFCANFFLTA